MTDDDPEFTAKIALAHLSEFPDYDTRLERMEQQAQDERRADQLQTTMPTEVIQVGAVSVRFVVEPAQSNGSVAVFEVFIPAQANMPAPHSHDGYEETIYGLAGTSTWTIENRAIDIGVGDAICIPRGAVHAFDNRGQADAKALAVVTPGILGADFFREAGAVLADARGGPPDVARLGEIMRRHGLTPAPPPS